MGMVDNLDDAEMVSDCYVEFLMGAARLGKSGLE